MYSSNLGKRFIRFRNDQHDDDAQSRSIHRVSETPPQKWLLTKKELAAVLNVCPRTVDNWIAQKRIPYFRLSGRLVRFDLRRVQSALERYEVREVGRHL